MPHGSGVRCAAKASRLLEDTAEWSATRFERAGGLIPRGFDSSVFRKRSCVHLVMQLGCLPSEASSILVSSVCCGVGKKLIRWPHKPESREHYPVPLPNRAAEVLEAAHDVANVEARVQLPPAARGRKSRVQIPSGRLWPSRVCRGWTSVNPKGLCGPVW